MAEDKDEKKNRLERFYKGDSGLWGMDIIEERLPKKHADDLGKLLQDPIEEWYDEHINPEGRLKDDKDIDKSAEKAADSLIGKLVGHHLGKDQQETFEGIDRLDIADDKKQNMKEFYRGEIERIFGVNHGQLKSDLREGIKGKKMEWILGYINNTIISTYQRHIAENIQKSLDYHLRENRDELTDHIQKRLSEDYKLSEGHKKTMQLREAFTWVQLYANQPHARKMIDDKGRDAVIQMDYDDVLQNAPGDPKKIFDNYDDVKKKADKHKKATVHNINDYKNTEKDKVA